MPGGIRESVGKRCVLFWFMSRLKPRLTRLQKKRDPSAARPDRLAAGKTKTSGRSTQDDGKCK
jgi:hypothetical protein